MRCPVDGETLLMTERSGVEIDYCPRCRGVWLDRGELDKIVERTGSTAHRTTSRAYEPKENRYQEKVRRERDEEKAHHKSSKDYYRKRKTKSFLKEIFDFD